MAKPKTRKKPLTKRQANLSEHALAVVHETTEVEDATKQALHDLFRCAVNDATPLGERAGRSSDYMHVAESLLRVIDNARRIRRSYLYSNEVPNG